MSTGDRSLLIYLRGLIAKRGDILELLDDNFWGCVTDMRSHRLTDTSSASLEAVVLRIYMVACESSL